MTAATDDADLSKKLDRIIELLEQHASQTIYVMPTRSAPTYPWNTPYWEPYYRPYVTSTHTPPKTTGVTYNTVHGTNI